jgi:hypothetical protein
VSRTSLEALIRRNAEACETSTSARCRCACGGEYHGQKHSEQWIADELEAVVELGAQRELELEVDEPELPL